MNKSITFASLITIIVLVLAYLGYIPSYISVTISLCIFAIAISYSICSAIRGSITEIKDCAFGECRSLENIKISNKVKTICSYAFIECDSLKNIIIPDATTSIDYGAFLGCDSLQRVTIGKSVESIDDLAFAECESLKDVVILNNSTMFAPATFEYSEKVVINGAAGSNAEKYANSQNIPFSKLS